jgi:hypothetical protein
VIHLPPCPAALTLEHQTSHAIDQPMISPHQSIVPFLETLIPHQIVHRNL